MRGIGPHPKPSLGTVPGLNIDLPPQTILDIEVVEEFTVRLVVVVVVHYCCCYLHISLAVYCCCCCVLLLDANTLTNHFTYGIVCN